MVHSSFVSLFLMFSAAMMMLVHGAPVSTLDALTNVEPILATNCIMVITSSRKRRRSSDEIAFTAYQQASTESNSTSIRTKKWKIVIYTEPNPNTDGLELNVEVDDIVRRMRDATEILGRNTNTFKCQPDGTIVIQPRYRQFPTEIVAMIVDHVCDFDDQRDLHACSLVNKQFHKVSNPLLWQSPKLNNELSLDRLVTYLSVAESPSLLTKQIQTLRVHGKHWTDAYLLLLLPYLRHLETLNIGDYTSKYNTTNITDQSLKHLPRHCRRLKLLDMTRISLSHQFFLHLGQHCPQFNALALDHCPHLPPNIFKLLDACPLDCVFFNYQDSPLGIMYGELVTDIAQLDSITTLTPHGLSSLHTKLLIDQATSRPSSWPHLSELTLSNATTLDDATLIPFLRSHPRLDDILLSSAHSIRGVTDATLDAMVTSLPDLSKVSLTNFPNTSPDGFRRLVRGAPKLQLLTLVNACHVDNKVLDPTALDKVRQMPVVVATITNTT
ncbi:unnamed protein product [Absidia cylindrospora]